MTGSVLAAAGTGLLVSGVIKLLLSDSEHFESPALLNARVVVGTKWFAIEGSF